MARALPDRPILRNAIALSVAVHGVLLLGLGPLSERGAWGAEEALEPAADHFAGNSPVSGDLVEVAISPGESGSEGVSGSESESESESEGESQPEPESESEPESEPEPEPEPEPERGSEGEVRPAKAPKATAGGPAPATRPAGAPAKPWAAGSFGAAGASGKARNLGYAFTRAIPPMSDSDPEWAKLPIGDAGEMVLTLHVDEEGHLTKLFVAKEPVAPRHLKRLAKNVGRRLRLGVFALQPTEVGAGKLVLRIRARVRDVPVPEDVPAGPFDLRFEFADGHGVAGFTQVSGRRVDLTVDVMDE